MPMYEFDCPECERRFESLSAAGTESAECPECGHAECPRVISAFNPIHRRMTANQRRRLEDKRGTDRGGARERWGKTMDKRRERKQGS